MFPILVFFCWFSHKTFLLYTSSFPFSTQTPLYSNNSLSNPGMSNLPSKLVQIGPQMGQIWDFLKSVSVHFGSAKFDVPGAWSYWLCLCSLSVTSLLSFSKLSIQFPIMNNWTTNDHHLKVSRIVLFMISGSLDFVCPSVSPSVHVQLNAMIVS